MLHTGGRYAHSIEYVTHAMRNAGFLGITIGEGELRTEGGRPVKGLLISARKPE